MATTETEVVAGIGNEYKYGFHDPEDYFFKSGRGLSPELAHKLEAKGYESYGEAAA